MSSRAPQNAGRGISYVSLLNCWLGTSPSPYEGEGGGEVYTLRR